MKKLLTALSALLFFSLAASAENELQDDFFNKHLHQKKYDLDTNADAIVLYEKKAYSINKGLISSEREVIKILKSSASKLGDVQFTVPNNPLHFTSITRITACAYTLEHGRMVKHEMPPSSIRIDKLNIVATIAKFSIPYVAEGSIIDYTVEMRQDAEYSLAEWKIQDKLPKLYSELSLSFLKQMHVTLVKQHTMPFVMFNDSTEMKDSILPEAYIINPQEGFTTTKCVRRNVPAIVWEDYVYNPYNYAERIDIEWGWGTWKARNNWFYNDDYSLGNMNGNYVGQLNPLLKKIDPGNDTTLEAAKKIYCYVRDHFIFKDDLDMVALRKMEWVLNHKLGNHAELNMALILLLRQQGFNANPVMLSKHSGLKLLENCALPLRIDCFVTRLKIGDQVYYLDPVDKNYPFGYISPDCYNGFSWVVNASGFGIMMHPSEIKERQVVQVKMEQADDHTYLLKVVHMPGTFAAYRMRTGWEKDSLSMRKYFQDKIAGNALSLSLVSYEVHGLNNPDTSLVMDYTYKFKLEDQHIIEPSLFNYFAENPFKTLTRHNPVEFPFALDLNYSFSLKVPEGYTIEGLPASTIYKIDDNNYYRYNISYYDDSRILLLNTKTNLSDTFFDVPDYLSLRSFFEKMTEAQQQSIILKKS